jgi:hypothetical protein
MEARVKAICGDPPSVSMAALLTSRSAVEAVEERQREHSACSIKVRAAFNSEVGAPTVGRPTFQPLLGDSTSAARAGNSEVDAILNVEASPAPTRIPFEYEMARTNSPDRDFLKRLSGELRSANGQQTWSIKVDDIDRNWLTTDQCATLDVTFQVTLETGTRTAGSSKVFPLARVTVDAPGGTAEVTVPASLGHAGTPVGVNVVGVSARACGTPASTPTDYPFCHSSPEELVKLATAKLELNTRVYLLSSFHSKKSAEVKQLQSEIQRYKRASAENNREQASLALAAVLTIAGTWAPPVAGAVAIVGLAEAVGTMMDESSSTLDLVYQDLKIISMSPDIAEIMARLRISARKGLRQAPQVSVAIDVAEMFKSSLDLSELRDVLDGLIVRLQQAESLLARSGKNLEKAREAFSRLESLCPTSGR